MPILIVVCETGDGEQPRRSAVSLVESRLGELSFYESVPIYSDISEYGDGDPQLTDLDCSFVSGKGNGNGKNGNGTNS